MPAKTCTIHKYAQSTVSSKAVAFLAALLWLLAMAAHLSPPVDAALSVDESIEKRGERSIYILTIEGIIVISLHGDDTEALRESGGKARKALSDWLNGKPGPEDVKVVISGRNAVLIAAKKEICTATPEQAKLQGITPFKLATQWALNIRSALVSLNSLKIAQSEITVPLNEYRDVTVEGSKDGNFQFQQYDQSVIEVTFDPARKVIRIKGLSTGWTALWIQRGNARKKLSVSVKKGAGTLPVSLTVTVTGDATSKEVIAEAIVANLRNSARVEDGAWIVIDRSALASLKPLSEGSEISVPVKATIKGEGLITVSRDVPVRVIGSAFNRKEPSVLLVSNNPEKILKAGVLLDEPIPHSSPARVIFHHLNAKESEPCTFRIRLKNSSSQDARVHILRSIAGPGGNEIYSGHLAALLFWERWLHGTGFVVTIPGGGEYEVEEVALKPNQLISGLDHFTCIESDPAKPVRLVIDSSSRNASSSSFHPEDNTTRVRGQFPNPEIVIDREHIIGKGYTFIYLGGKPYLREKDSNQENMGNYGALYRITISVENQGNTEETADVVFTPGGGPASGVFLIDGVLKETPFAVHLQEVLLARLTVSPNEKKQVQLVTFPQSGSNYPVRIVVKSALTGTDRRDQ
jgi:hypothetical protein